MYFIKKIFILFMLSNILQRHIKTTRTVVIKSRLNRSNGIRFYSIKFSEEIFYIIFDEENRSRSSKFIAFHWAQKEKTSSYCISIKIPSEKIDFRCFRAFIHPKLKFLASMSIFPKK